MRIIKPSYEIMTPIDREILLKTIEIAGRTCYRSSDKITGDSASKFVKMLIKNGHEAMIEHNSISVKFVCDRGVSHEIVRHRIASFAQESTRYCNYSNDKFGNEITVIEPFFFDNHLDSYGYDDTRYFYWKEACEHCEEYYFNLIKLGCSPQEARSVLPNSLKTEIVVTMNLREWRHFFKLRCASVAHPQMREIAIPLFGEMKQLLPELFEDIVIK
jgi:thymidylate synthase (FAD)